MRRDVRAREVGIARRREPEHRVVLRHTGGQPELEFLESIDALCLDALGLLDDERVACDVLRRAHCLVSVELRRREVGRARDDDAVILDGRDGAGSTARVRFAGIDAVLIDAAADVHSVLVCRRLCRRAVCDGVAADDLRRKCTVCEVQGVLACRRRRSRPLRVGIGPAAANLLPRSSGGEGDGIL